MPGGHLPDSKVYNELQVLKDFVQFISALELCNVRCKQDAESILEYIEELDILPKKSIGVRA